MKRAFTLIEMLVVVVVLVTLMTMVFRLGSVGNDSWRRSETIARLQKVENCLSGYYAAFGSYPPVKLHGTRDINQQVTSNGIQDGSQSVDWGNEANAWRQVDAACRAQPVACNFPFPSGYSDVIRSLSDEIATIVNDQTEGYEDLWSSDGGKTVDEKKRAKFSAGFDDGGVSGGTGIFSGYEQYADWRNLQLFRFGLMSYLLPRYLVMMNGAAQFFDGDFVQWSDNNVKPSNPYTGRPYASWDEMKQLNESGAKSDIAQLANIPSQAVCARWMPNLAGICAVTHDFTLFGVDIRDRSFPSPLSVAAANDLPIYTPGGKEGNSDQYVLDFITLKDGWYRDFYYYSPAPYQRYTLWSAGANGKTFPPWMSRKDLSSQANQVVSKWIKDDIIGMSN